MSDVIKRAQSFAQTRLNLYDALNFLPTISARVFSIILRRPCRPEDTNSRAGVYARAQARYDYIVQGGELINRAPPLQGEPLLYVQPEDHSVLRSLGAVERDGEWYMPSEIDMESQWRFGRWFAKAPIDLEINEKSWRLTRDGKSTNGYIHPEDLWRGGDSTATSLVMGAIPVIVALGYLLNVVSPLLALAVCLPLLALHVFTLHQCEGPWTVLKVLGVSVLLPAVMSGLFGNVIDMNNLQSALPKLGGAVFALSFLASRSTSGAAGTALLSMISRLKHAVGISIFVLAVNLALALLPSSLSFVRPLGWFMVACAYPLYYTWSNFKQRTAELELQSKQKAGGE